MLKTHEIFAKMPASVADQIFDYLGEKQKNLMSVLTDALCREQKLRPVFVQRKSPADFRKWISSGLSRVRHEGDAAHLLQIWLVGTQTKLLCDFLDGLGIAHDENGTIEQVPPSPDKAKLTEVVNDLVTKHDPLVVSVYLHAFQATNDEVWAPLDEILAEDARLKLG